MQLTLEIVSYHKYAIETEIAKVYSLIDQGRLITLGRAKENDWYLPDPERVISSEHAQILITDNSFSIRDVSTNGVYINGSVSPLGKNKSYNLNDGDVINISDYKIGVKIRETETEDKSTAQENGRISRLLINEPETDMIFHEDFGISSELLVDDVDNRKSKVQTLDGDLDDSFHFPNYHDKGKINLGDIPENWSLSLKNEVENTYDTLQQDNDTFESKLPDSLKEINLETTDIYKNFVKGLGVNPSMIPDGSHEKFWMLMGSSLRLLLEGMVETLHSRTEFKQQKRLNQTLFRKTENNPIKFSGTIEDLLHNLFIRESSSFMSPEMAIKEAFDDIKEHEKAIQAGLEGSIRGILGILSPNKIEVKNGYETTWARKLFKNESKNNWNQYLTVYEKMTQDIDSYKFYMDDFNKAYEKYINEK